MFINHVIFLLALGFFSASAVLLGRRKAIPPQFVATLVFLLMGLLVLLPQMIFSENREYILSLRTQIFVLIASISFLGASYFVRRPKMRSELSPPRWRFLTTRGWIILYFIICLSDPLLSFYLHGQVGLVKGNQSMGTGGGLGGDVFTPLTFFAWAAAAMAMTTLMTDYLFSFSNVLAFLKTRAPDVALVVGCFACTALSGNRFVLVCQLISLLLALALFRKLKLWVLVTTSICLCLFFVLIGNFRFGIVDVVDTLEHPTGIKAFDTLYAWVVTYTEPNFPNLDNFIRDQPAAQWGLNWVTTILPSGVDDALGLERSTSAQWLAENKLYAYRGLTFRTLYPDLMVDFGFTGAIFLSCCLLAFGVYSYNRALRSPFHFVTFLTYAPLILFMPLLAGFYSLANLVPFAILLLLRPNTGLRRPPKRRLLVPKLQLQRN